MNVVAGNRIVVHGHRVGDAERHGEVLEVRNGGASESWRVRWDPDGHEGLLYPGPDAALEPGTASATPRKPHPRKPHPRKPHPKKEKR